MTSSQKNCDHPPREWRLVTSTLVVVCAECRTVLGEQCSMCSGDGIPSVGHNCTHCGGIGWVRYPKQEPEG